jgi:hypothetical protein
MKSAWIILTVAVCLSQPSASQQQKPCFTCILSSFSAYVSALLNNESVLFTKLGEGQAKQTIIDVHTEAGQLWSKNDKLAKDLIAGNVTRKELAERVSRLTSDVQHFDNSLTRFSGEIAKASNLTSSALQNQIQSHINSKLEDLRRISDLDPNVLSQRGEALKFLKLSNNELEQVQHGTKCLLDSIALKAPACDPNTFESLDSSQHK